jgi:hypothetical protein
MFYCVLLATYTYLLQDSMDMSEAVLLGGILGLFTWGAVGSIVSARLAFRDWRLLAAASQGIAPADGQWVAVSGTIQPLDQPLRSPFGGRECVVCEYDLGRAEDDSEHAKTPRRGCDYGGFLMTPSVIRSPTGEVRLLGFPILEHFEDCTLKSYEAALHAIEFISTNSFEDRSGIRIASLLSLFREIWCDDDGRVEKHVRFSKASAEELFPGELLADMERQLGLNGPEDSDGLALGTEIPSPIPSVDSDETGDAESLDETDSDLERDEVSETDDDDETDWDLGLPARLPKMREKIVPVGAEVCAIGRYDQARRGLLPLPNQQTPNRLLSGAAVLNADRSRRSMVRRMVGGLIVLAITQAVLFGIVRFTKAAKRAAGVAPDAPTLFVVRADSVR